MRLTVHFAALALLTWPTLMRAQLPKPADFPVGSPERLWVTEI
jgi:hypothetical protein